MHVRIWVTFAKIQCRNSDHILTWSHRKMKRGRQHAVAERRAAATPSARAGLVGKLLPRRIFCAHHGAPDTTRSCFSDAAPVPQASNWCMQGQSEPFSAACGPIRTRPAETAHDRPMTGYWGNFDDKRATFSSTGLFAFPRAISGKTQPCSGPREGEAAEVGVATLFIRTQEPAKNFDHRM